MVLADEDNYIESDHSGDEEQYSKLLNSIVQLDSTQRVKPPSRKEISTEVSEFNLQEGVVKVNELAQVLKNKVNHVSISKTLKKVTEKSKTLPKPLEKSVEDKLKRSIGYENVQKQLKRWNAVVKRNSLKDQLCFPLKNKYVSLQNSSEFLSQFKTSTPLETELKNVLKQDKPLPNDKDNEEFPLTLQEMLEKRKEIAQLRAKLSYKEAKAQRQNKIKSKKYHRILKREKLKNQLKEFEILQKTDPTRALEKLSELDKSRALERASLRHRNTGKWAKNLTVRAKYDVETRKILAEQLKVSREITQKTQKNDSSDEEDSNIPNQESLNGNTGNLVISKENPWSLDVSKEVQDFVTNYRKFWDEKNKETINNNKENEPKDMECENGKNENNTSEEKENKNCTDDNVNSEIKTNNLNNNLSTIKETKLGKNFEKDEKILNNASDLNNTSLSKKTKKKKSLKNANQKKGSNHPRTDKTLEKMNSNSFVNKNSKNNAIVTMRPTSGIWIITPTLSSPESTQEISKKRKAKDINELFNDLEDRLNKRATKKLKLLNKNLKKSEKVKKKTKLKEKEMDQDKLKLSLRSFNAVQKPDLDVEMLEGTTRENNSETNFNDSFIPENAQNSAPMEVDPKKFLQLKPKKLGAFVSEESVGDDDAIDDEIKRQQIIEEAFGEDDVVAEFNKAKETEGNKTEIEISNSLPGWGNWGGTGIKPSKRKKKLFKIAKVPPRKDKALPDMIINENENPNIKEHLVKTVPYPFKSSAAFESNLRAPVGREWVPESAHLKLIENPVETKLGTIIEPMDEDEILANKKRIKSPYVGKRKEKKKL